MHIAQVNIAKMKEPLTSDLMKEFVDFLEPVNKLADESPGFIWRLQDEQGGPSTYVESPFVDDMIIINISVWEDMESLKNFVYNTVHGYFVRSGRKWFHKMDSPQVAMWWIDKNHIPTVDESVEKLNNLERSGPSTEVFTMKKPFLPDGQPYLWKR